MDDCNFTYHVSQSEFTQLYRAVCMNGKHTVYDTGYESKSEKLAIKRCKTAVANITQSNPRENKTRYWL